MARRFIVSVLGLCILGTSVGIVPAQAASACGWTAQMEDDEGGRIMAASSCESDTDNGPAFRLICADGINIRYDGSDAGMGDNPPESATFVMASGGKSASADFVYEEMDGMFAAYVKPDSDIVALLKSGSDVGVTLKGGTMPPRKVSLRGSSAAIDTLIKTCK